MTVSWKTQHSEKKVLHKITFPTTCNPQVLTVHLAIIQVMLKNFSPGGRPDGDWKLHLNANVALENRSILKPHIGTQTLFAGTETGWRLEASGATVSPNFRHPSTFTENGCLKSCAIGAPKRFQSPGGKYLHANNVTMKQCEFAAPKPPFGMQTLFNTKPGSFCRRLTEAACHSRSGRQPQWAREA